MYSPHRDIAYFGPFFMAKVTNYINKNYWPELTTMVAKLMGTDEDTAWNAIIDCHDAYYRYIAECCRDSKETPADVYKRVGWDDLPEGARWGYHAILGLMFSTKLFSGLRDEHQQGQAVDIGEVASRAFGHVTSYFNGQDGPEGGLKALREQVKECRRKGSSYEDILAAVNLERLGG
jgi:hypothetical protein